MLGPDRDRKAAIQDVPDERHQHELLLQDVQHLADGANGVEGGCHPGRAADENLRVAVQVATAVAEGGVGELDDPVHDRVLGSRDRHRVAHRFPGQVRGQVRRSGRHLRLAGVVGQFEGVLVDGPAAKNGHDHRHFGCQAHQLDGADAGRVCPLADDHRRIVGKPRKKAAGVGQHPFQLSVGGGEKRPNLLRLRRRQMSRLGDGVHEEAVALVGRYPPGAGVRLRQVPLPLEQPHLVSHRRRGHGKFRNARNRPRPHRLRSLDVLLHYRFEDGSFPVVEHVGTQRYRVPMPTRLREPEIPDLTTATTAIPPGAGPG